MTKKESLLPSVGLWSKPVIERFKSELDSLIEDLFTGRGRTWDIAVFDDMQPKVSFPKVNVSESENGYVVEIAVAGFGKDDVKLELKDNDLFISAEKREENGENDESKYLKYLRQEISYRSFKRAVRFPDPINSSTAEAEYKDGIITFKVNKEEDKKIDGVTIEVK